MLTAERRTEVLDWLEHSVTEDFFRYLDTRAGMLEEQMGTVMYDGEPQRTQEVRKELSGGVQELRFVTGLAERLEDDMDEVFGDE